MPLISGRAKQFLDAEDDLFTLAKPIEEDYLSQLLLNHGSSRSAKRTILSIEQQSSRRQMSFGLSPRWV